MIRVEDTSFIARHGDTQYRFPRMSTDGQGRLLLFYRVGLTHMRDTGGIAMRTSTDGGESWSAPEVFDSNPGRSSYYMTDVVRVSDGLIGSGSTFALPGVQPCHNILWHSADDGRSWQERSILTPPQENLGDEVAMLEPEPGRILLILRHRPKTDTLAFVSDDGGRTWGERRSISHMVGVLQRPLLRRLTDGSIFLSGRDYETKEVVVFLSTDDGETFGERCMVESYNADGAYTGAAEVEKGMVVLVYYSDRVRAHCPDLVQAVLRVE